MAGDRAWNDTGSPETLFAVDGFVFLGGIRNYQVDLDGSRFLFIGEGPTGDGAGTAEPLALVVVDNWFTELEARVPLP